MTRPAEPRPRDVHALLSDGTTVRIHRAAPSDSDEVLRLYEGMSAQNLRLRFFSVSDRSARLAADHVRDPGFGRCALLAHVAGHLVGIAEYAQCPADTGPVGARAPRTADISVAVADAWHHHGVGTLLLEHLVDAAREAGIRAFSADALSENREILKVFADLGLRTSRWFEGPEVRFLVHLETDEHYREAVDARDSAADVLSLRPLLEPRSIAVVGAGRRPGSVGRAVLRNLSESGYPGTLHAVNPRAHCVAGVSSYPSLDALPTAPDLAVVAVPAAEVPATADACGKRGVRALVVLSSGLDAEHSAALLATCRTYGMRLVGPNCLGIASTTDALRMNATFAAHCPTRGTAGVAVQSGGVGIAVLDKLSRLGIGVSSFVSLGDKLDVSGNDMLRWWESDGTTDLVVLHMESFGNPRAFSRTARRVARRMPVLTVDAGRSDAGRRAAASHTAAAATPTMTRQALFGQAGVIATDGIGELIDTAALLHSQPLPSGTSVAVVSNAGGIGVLAADACVEAGLQVPSLHSTLNDGLLEILPPGASAANPVDTTAAVSEEQLRACVDRLAEARGLDAVLVVLAPTALAAATGDDPVRALTHNLGHRPRTIAAVLTDLTTSTELRPTGSGSAVPVYADARQAARALAHAAHYAQWRARPPGTVPEAHGTVPEAARALVAEYLAENPGGGWLDPLGCARLLEHYGVPQLPWRWATDEEEAAQAVASLTAQGADRVALKAYWPGLVHKSDEGAVVLDLDGEDRVRAAYRRLATRFEGQMSGAVVQSMARRGVELFAGVVQDDVFGPLILFGLGGTATELLADHAARLAPLTDQDVHDLITSPRCAPLLFGHRGTQPVDLEALERLLAALSRMATDLPQLAETDLNPVMAGPGGVVAVDARIRLVPRHRKDPYLRRLR
ncbi:bifunctional acetate--CoA ligase family protein/GNAT family N-acetyltransferase [Streptomyces sp. NPDC054796]